jgi:hypothetical protein
MIGAPLFIKVSAVVRLLLLFSFDIIIAYFAIREQTIVLISVFSIFAFELMLDKLIAGECTGATFVCILAKEFYLLYHIFQNWVDLYELGVPLMTVRARIVLVLPAFNALFTE